MASFWKPEACGQTVLPDRSIWKGQKLVENVKIENFICDIFSNFQTMWRRLLGSCGLDKKTFQDSVKLLAKIRLLLFTFWPFVRTTVLAMQSNKCICIEARGLLGSSHVAFHFLWSYEVKPRSINFDTLNSQGGNARRMKPRLDFLQPSLEKKYDRHFCNKVRFEAISRPFKNCAWITSYELATHSSALFQNFIFCPKILFNLTKKMIF